MSARDEILGRVRAALAGADRGEVTVPRGYRADQGGVRADLFVQRVEDYRATVSRCSTADVEEHVSTALGGAGSVLVPSGLELDLPGAVTDSGQSPQSLDAMDAVVTLASVAIASTGTIVLEHGAGQGRRALTLVPDLHICIVRADQIVAGVPQAIAMLDPERPQTWISGPSATSDIELNRVEGVHGPRTLHVVLVEP